MKKRPYYTWELPKYGVIVTLKSIYQKFIVRFLKQSINLILSSVMSYLTRSCVVIELVVPLMGFLVQLKSFDYSSLKIIDYQKFVHEIHHEESNHHEKLSPSINYECTVKIDGVVKISVIKINEPNDRTPKLYAIFFMRLSA